MSYKLKTTRKITEGEIYDAYFEADNYQVEITKKAPFGKGEYQETVGAFDLNDKTYAVLGFDHFNGHMSNFKDRAAIYGITIAEIVEY